jgi:hypothetical protein
MVGGEVLSRDQIRGLMTGCWRHTVAKRLFRHTVAAMLNGLACGDAPDDLIAQANTFLTEHPRHGCLSRTERQAARSLKNALREFNRRDNEDKAAETDPEWDESTEPMTWNEVKSLF